MMVAPGPNDPDAGTRTYVTLAFMDLCGSTSLANGLDPDVFAALLNTLRASVSGIVLAHDGVVSQIYGDGLLAVYRGEASSARALAATLAVHDATRRLTVPAGSPLPRMLMHSGVHSGLVLLRPGDVERGRIETVGRPTGVAARLSSAARPDEILVSRSTLGPMGFGLQLGATRMVEVSSARDHIAAVPVLGILGEGAQAPSNAFGRRTPLVGRAAILDEIALALLAERSGKVACVAVVGPAGQGKSRLSEEIELRAGSAQVVVLRGTAALGESASTLQPFREIDAAAMVLLGEERPGAADDLASLPEAIAGRLRRLAERQPLLLILDDWQWADSASIQLLASLRRQDAQMAVMLLSREAQPGELPLDADTVIELPPVSEGDAAALIQRLRPELDELDRAQVVRLAGGNPLYLEELCLLSTVALGGLPAAEANQDEIGRVASIIEARLRPLPSDLGLVLQTAAVIGGECSAAILSRLCGFAVDAAMLDKLRELEFLIPSPSPGGVRFKHGITRSVVYQLMRLDQRRVLHAKVAELVIDQDPLPGMDRDEMLAWHYSESGQAELAIVHAERAGDRAVAAASIDRAQLQYRRALKALDQLPADATYRDRLRLIGKYGFACVYDSDPSQLPAFDRACALTQEQGDADGEALVRFWRSFICHGIGHARGAVAEVSRALALTSEGVDSPFHVQLRATLGQALAAAGRYRAAAPLLDEAIDVKRAHRSGRNVSVGTAYSLALRAAIDADTGHFPAARAAIEEALALLAERHHPVEGSVLCWSAAVHLWQGDWPGLLETAERGCTVALRIEAVYIHAISRAFASYARWKLTGCDEAADELIRSVACMADRGKELALSLAYGCVAEVQAARGDEAAVQAALRQTYRRAREGEPFGVAMAARASARLLASAAPDRARRMLAHARSNARFRGSTPELARCDLDEAELGLLPPDLALARLVEAAEAFASMGLSAEASRADLLIQAARPRPARARRA